MTVMSTPSGEVTGLLAAWSRGDQAALDRLVPLVYDELRRLAGSYLRREHGNRTMSATALVHEAYVRLVDQDGVQCENRAHFFGIAANLMRQVLVQEARRRQAAKRGGAALSITLDEAIAAPAERTIDLVALDDALSTLSSRDARKSQIVELRFFGGLSVEETAAILGLSPRTVKREWRLSKAWLYHELSRGSHDAGALAED